MMVGGTKLALSEVKDRREHRLAEVALPPINGIKRYARRRFGRGLPTLTVLLRRWCR
jgi:hypothetical protein